MRRVLLVLLALATGLLAALVPAPPRPAGGADAQFAASAAPPARNEALPACTYADLPAPRSGLDQWRETVLDTVYALPADYEPLDLVPVAGAFPPGQPGGGELRVRAIMLDDLEAMLAAAAEQGLALAIQSAYRSYAYQASTFQYWVERNGEEAALATSARPGHSEHQLGTAIDLRSLDGPPAWDLEDWAETPEGSWAEANAWRFGFVMSYPRGSAGVTCYSYEPWHYRYLGRELAAEVRRLEVTPRELLWARAAVERID